MGIPTVADQTRIAASDLVIDLEWNFRYYTAKADDFQRLAFRVRFAILVGVIVEGSIAYPMSQITWGWTSLLSLGILLGGLAVWRFGTP